MVNLAIAMSAMLTDVAAAALPAGCGQTGSTVTCTYTSGSNPFTVPVGVSSIHVLAVGGIGGGGSGGHGAAVDGDLNVTAGSTLYAVVAGTAR